MSLPIWQLLSTYVVGENRKILFRLISERNFEGKFPAKMMQNLIILFSILMIISIVLIIFIPGSLEYQ